MNKIALVLLAGLLSLNTHAKGSFWCDYADYFHLSAASDPWLIISEANANREVLLFVLSPKSFELRDAGKCISGYAHVTYSYDKTHWCILDIKDGPTLWHPVIQASCAGLKYMGLGYDGDHSYTIHIEPIISDSSSVK
ncbi:MAG: hypothetical protein H0U73_13855 [Tatlockia sp.]|nr:hypothetical protein [Tatlockia sp.]